MRVNIYAEEMTDRVEIISKEIDSHRFTGCRLYLELPVTSIWGGKPNPPMTGLFIHRINDDGSWDDDSAAVTFWGKRDLRDVLRKMLVELDKHYATKP